jgi:hypothetical protein
MSQYKTTPRPRHQLDSPEKAAHLSYGVFGSAGDFEPLIQTPYFRPARPFSNCSSISHVPLDISPDWFSGTRELPLALCNLAPVNTKTSFESLIKLQTDFFAESELDLPPFVGDFPLKWEVDRLEIASAPYLFYDEHGTTVAENVLLSRRAETALRFSNLAPNAVLLVRLRGEDHARTALWNDLITPARPTFRLVNSCMVNSDRYLRPLLEYAIGGGCEVISVCGGKSGPELRVLQSGVSGYKAAQLLDISGSTPLLVLRAVSSLDDALAVAVGRFLDKQAATVTLPGIITDNKFVGSGKYTPIEYGEPLRGILSALIGIGLLERCANDGAVIVTEAGARLLFVLTPRLFDPDARLRWSDPATDLLRPEHAEASERWVQNFYGEMRSVAIRHCRRTSSSDNIALELLDMLIGDQ